jgi:hypothetical protein
VDFEHLKKKLEAFAGKEATKSGRLSGFRAIQQSCCSFPVSPAEELYHEFSGVTPGGSLLLRCTASDLLVIDSMNCTMPTKTLPIKVNTEALFTASLPEFVYIDDFQKIALPEQQRLLASFRGKRENSQNLRLIVAGQWHYHEFMKEWNDASNADKPLGSPPFNDVLTLCGYSSNEIKRRLQVYISDNLAIEYHSDHLWRMTRGDKDLVEIVEDSLSHTSEHPERLFDRLDDIPSVQELVFHRCYELPQRARDILSATLRFQRIRLPHNDIDAEILYLRGLLRKADENSIGDRAIWEISSPTIAFALLRYWKDRDGNIFEHTRELLPPLQSAASEAYEIVCHIENLLRNMLCLVIGCEPGKDLRSELLRILPKEQQDITTQRLGRDNKERDISLRQTLSSYLDLDTLATAFCSNKTLEVRIEAIFSDTRALKVKLDEFARFRIHVAHGRPVSSCIVRDLKELRKWFEVALAEGGYKSLTKAELSRFPIIIVNARIDGNPPRLLLTIGNKSDKSLPINTKLIAFIEDRWRSKPITVHLAAGKQSTISFDDCKEINSNDLDKITFELC